MSRDDTSLPIVYPAMRPFLPSTTPISGSGTFQVESSRIPIGAPGPTVRRIIASFMKSSGRGAS